MIGGHKCGKEKDGDDWGSSCPKVAHQAKGLGQGQANHEARKYPLSCGAPAPHVEPRIPFRHHNTVVVGPRGAVGT